MRYTARWRRFFRFFDWRFFAAIAACVTLLLLAVTEITSINDRHKADDRIQALVEDRKVLQFQNADLRQKIGANTEAIQALAAQVDQLGGRPVVPVTTHSAKNQPTGSPLSPANSSPGTTTPAKSTTTTTTKSHRPTTTTTRTCVVNPICLQGLT